MSDRVSGAITRGCSVDQGANALDAMLEIVWVAATAFQSCGDSSALAVFDYDIREVIALVLFASAIPLPSVFQFV